MKKTYIAAILIAITANSASAQQTVTIPYQAGQSWPATGQAYQSHVPQVQYRQTPVQQSYPQSSSYGVQPAPYVPQGQYYTVPQTVVQPTVPATPSPTATTSVLPQAVGQQNQLQQAQVVAPSRAPAPAPSIPPQPGDFIVPAPTAVVAQPVQPVEVGVLETQQPQELTAVDPVDQAVVPSDTLSAPALSESEGVVAAPTTPSLVALPEPTRPVEAGVLETPEVQEELAVVEKAVSPVDTAPVVVENQSEAEPVIGGRQLGDLTGELVAAPELSHETTPDANNIEDLIAPAVDVDLANIESTEIDSTEQLDEGGTGATELAATEMEVASEARIESTESRSLDSSIESEPLESAVLESAVLAAAPAEEASNNVAQSSDTKQANVPLASTDLKKPESTINTVSRKVGSTTNYSNWFLGLLPMLAIPIIGWLWLRKRKQNAEVNSFANEALSRVNSKPTSSKSVPEKPSQREKLATIARGGSKESPADSSSTVRSRLDELVKSVDRKKSTAGGTSTNERAEVTASTSDFSSCDQFCCIRGIDSNTQEMLHKAGFVRFSDLEKATQSELKVALAGNANQFSSSDFSRWSSLSALAGNGDWDGFETLQASFAAPEVSEVSEERSEQLDVAPATTAVDADDLTKVRGIGPATAELLNGAGIATFEALADAGTVRLQEILKSGGDKFDAIDPSLWCRQAQFQITGTWTRPRIETVKLRAESKAVSPNVTVTTPEYRITEPTLELEGSAKDNDQASSSDSLAEMTGIVGAISKEEAQRLEQLAGEPSQLNDDESALLDQINAIRDIAKSSAESKVSDQADAPTASAE